MTRHYWLASYPKSGTTWIRMLLANLGRDAPADINAPGDDGEIASNRDRLDRLTLLPSALLTDAEIAGLRPEVHQAIAEGRIDALTDRSRAIGGARFVKAAFVYQTLAQLRDATPLDDAHPAGRVELAIPGCTDGPGGGCPVEGFRRIIAAAAPPNCVAPLKPEKAGP